MFIFKTLWGYSFNVCTQLFLQREFNSVRIDYARGSIHFRMSDSLVSLHHLWNGALVIDLLRIVRVHILINLLIYHVQRMFNGFWQNIWNYIYLSLRVQQKMGTSIEYHLLWFFLLRNSPAHPPARLLHL